jgi:hypothetical protein
MTAIKLTEPKFAELVIAAIEAWEGNRGPYLRHEHRVKARELGYEEGEFDQLWLDAEKRKLAGVSGRFDALRPKIEEVANDPNLASLVKKEKAAEAKPAPTYRRYTNPNLRIVSDNSGAARKAVVAKFVQDNLARQAEPAEARAEPREEPNTDEEAAPNSLADLTLPGVAGDVQDHFLRSTMQPSRIMSLAVGLMVPTTLVCGVVIGPSGPKGCALHQTIIVLGPTTSGKLRAIDCTKECICEAGDTAQFLLGPNRFKSGPAVVRWVSEHPVSLCIQDEFGRLLAKFSDPKSNPCEVEINDRMREFAALGPGSVYHSPHGASKLDDSVAIVDPRLNIFGFGVQQEFYDACEADDIDNGFLNRLTILNEPNKIRINTNLEPVEFPLRLKIKLEALYNIKPTKLDWTAAAKEIWEAEVERVWLSDERGQNLWGRTPEKIVRAASTFAVSRFAKKVERADMELAQVIMLQSDKTFKLGIDDAQKKKRLDHASLKLEIIRRVKADFRNPETGKYEASEAEIKRSFRHNTKHKKAVPDAIDDLIDSGTFTKHVIKTLGAPKKVLRLEEE